jgi:nitroimidazol reductase NimA-like FMN-containing flavoprotein (pyridoxamine 5'-phosphate oxidase superfamily)
MAVNVLEKVREHTSEIRQMSLGTIEPDGSPRVTELDFVVRAGSLATICFRSPGTRHTDNIAADPRVSGTISREYARGEKPAKGVESVAFYGTAALLGAGAERDEFAALFIEQHGAKHDIVQVAERGGTQFYTIDVTGWEYRGAPDGTNPQTYVAMLDPGNPGS